MDIMNYFEDLNDFPKYLNYKDDVYVLIIYRHEYDCNSCAYWAMFAKQTLTGFSKKNVLFHVNGTTLPNVLYKLTLIYKEIYKKGLVKSKQWLGNEPYEVDFDNESRNKYVTFVEP